METDNSLEFNNKLGCYLLPLGQLKQLVADEFGPSEVVDASNLTEWVEYYFEYMPIAVAI